MMFGTHVLRAFYRNQEILTLKGNLYHRFDDLVQMLMILKVDFEILDNEKDRITSIYIDVKQLKNI